MIYNAPYMDPGGFETTVPPNAQAPLMMTPNGMMAMSSQPHLSFAGWIVGLLALKFFTESDILNLNVAEVKISLFNILAITIQAGFGFIGLKVLVGWLIARGVAIPGLADFVGAF